MTAKMTQPDQNARAFWWLAGLFALLSGIFLLCLATGLGGRGVTELTDDIGELFAPVVAAAFCGLASRRAPAARLSWALLGASCASWAAGEVVWCYYAVVRGVTVPFPSLADAGYLAAVPLFVAGLVTYPGAVRKVSYRLRGLLDAAMITGSLLFVSWALILGPTFRSHQGGVLKQILAVSYPAGDALMVSLALIVAIGGGRRDGVCLGLVMVGIGAFAIADSSFAYFTTLNSYGIGNSFDTGWVAGYFLIALGALKALRVAPAAADGHAYDRPTLASVLTPYGAVGLAAAVALARYAQGRAFGPFLSFEGLALIVTLVARQFLTLADNLSLNRRLVGKVEQGNEQLRYQAFHDPLTGLANRALFEEHLDNAVQRCHGSAGSLEVLFIDLHNFRAVNLLYGNARGDQLLREVGDRLKATLRNADVVARVEGDKFAVLLEGPAGWVGPGAAAERLIESFSRPFGDGANQIVVQAAVGVAVSEVDGEPDKELLRSARQAMNVAREAGAGSYVRFTPVLHQGILDRARIEIELQRALDRDELLLYYQPVVALASGEIKGVEALIRWAHPEKGLVPPGMFIAVAESSGLIVTIGEWVLRQACHDLQELAGSGAPMLRMSVNVSPRQLSHPGFEAMVIKVLDDSGADPNRLTLEITESLLINDTAGKADVLRRLRLLGITIALDDFGTGYSSLSSLRDMPIDVLKIDKSFIDNIATSAEAACLTQTIIHLANDLGLATVAEGAETLEQVEMLRDLGCGLVQGYYFSKPVPAPELELMLQNGTAVLAAVMG
jgi:diguanylate cyclase (GGDEF)-like protein